LNLRDEETGGPRSGRGLFAERDGHSLGRLTATNQGGPILGDARACEKHRFAQCTADDGAYIESSGHLSTESFFKVPGDEVHDAPVKFVPTEFEGGVPPWPPFEAEIKYDANAQHRWNKQARPGLWRVQYRVPFTHAIPPTWKPPIKPPVPPIDAPPTPPWPTFVNACLPDPSIQPIVGENEIWAPSHDWIPAPSTGSGEETPFPGVSLKSAGFAAENAGITDASAGGAIVLPPRRGIAQAQEESGTRDTFFALHPEVVLAFGFPRHTGSGAGRIASGWNMKPISWPKLLIRMRRFSLTKRAACTSPATRKSARAARCSQARKTPAPSGSLRVQVRALPLAPRRSCIAPRHRCCVRTVKSRRPAPASTAS
jgi:hypothetical protein